jgi:hypothetical protein
MSVIGLPVQFGGYAPHPKKPTETPLDTLCSVCHNDVTEEEWDTPQAVEWPACGHFGHRECLKHVAICPNCRTPLGRPAQAYVAPAPAYVAPAPAQVAPPQRNSTSELRELQQRYREQILRFINRTRANNTFDQRQDELRRMLDTARSFGVVLNLRQLGLEPRP